MLLYLVIGQSAIGQNNPNKVSESSERMIFG